jgi:hypothetical protein
VRAICTNPRFQDEYYSLFDKGYEDADDLHSQLSQAFGSSYDYLDPTLLNLVEQTRVSAVSGPELADRKDICSSQAFASTLRLDQIVRCLCFTHF